MLRSSPSGGAGTRASISTSSRPSPAVIGASVRVTVEQLVERHLDGRPDVEEHAVSVQPPVGRALGLHAADAVEACRQDALGLGQRGEPAGRVTHRREIAHLGQRHEALVGRVLAGGAVEEVDVLDRRHARDVEVGEPPEMQAPRDHRVQPAGDALLLKPPFGRAEREVMHVGTSPTAHGHRHPPHRRGQLRPVDGGAELGGHRVGIGRRLAPVKVEVDDGLRGGGLGCQRGDGRGGRGQLRGLGERGDQLDAPAVERVAGGDELPSVEARRAHLLERTDLVVAAREELEERPVAVAPADAAPPAAG